MSFELIPTLFDQVLSDHFDNIEATDPGTAERIFSWIQQQPVFRWKENHNFCEARAEAASLLLEAAQIPHAKCWVFGAAFLYKGFVGGLKHNWNYHVAVAVPVQVANEMQWFVIDPSAASSPVLLFDWAVGVTDYPHSYHAIKHPAYYIFPAGKVSQGFWHKRHHRNFRWAMQGLAGINALNPVGKAQLAFNKKRIIKTTNAFLQLRNGLQAPGIVPFSVI